jgi:succinate dehydrogenase / fumarate reductase membrane anchor subunit
VAPVGRIRTPLSRVRFLGSARGGTRDFWMIRVTGAALFLLSFIFVAVLIVAIGSPYEDVIGLIGSPLVAAVFVLLIAVTAIHMRIGMQEIIEDYLHHEPAKLLASVANTFFAAAVGVVGAIAVIQIAVQA